MLTASGANLEKKEKRKVFNATDGLPCHNIPETIDEIKQVTSQKKQQKKTGLCYLTRFHIIQQKLLSFFRPQKYNS